MPSIVWDRGVQDAFDNPYEYAAEEQFVHEASRLLHRFYKLLNSEKNRYTVEDRSAEKAVWLLQMDALDSLRDCLDALQRKGHRTAGKLFRDVGETLDLAAYFRSGEEGSERHLQAWYKDEVIPHRVYREYLRRTEGEQPFEESRRHYGALSRFTHRSYVILLHGYILGTEGRLAHGGTGSIFGTSEHAPTMLIPRQTLSMYFAALASQILIFSDQLVRLGAVDVAEVQDAFRESLEVETVPRRFMPREWVMQQFREKSSGKCSEVAGGEPSSPAEPPAAPS
jgi:hypothetical protein